MQPVQFDRSTGIKCRRAGILRASVFLIIFGTAKYVERDSFHQDESVLQSAVEVSFVTLGTCLAIAAAIYHRVVPRVHSAYFLVLLPLCLAVVFSFRSWDPTLSFGRGALLIMISASTVALLRTFGVRPLISSFITAYIILIGLGLLIATIAPNNFPLMLHDPGEEGLRLRLHILKIHPIALADTCATCLIVSAIFRGWWIRCFRVIFATCLILTVTRTSIVFGLPIYVAAEIVSIGWHRARFKPAHVIGVLILIPAMLGIGMIFAFSDWAPIDNFRADFLHVLDATESNSTLNGRTVLWAMLISDLSFENFYGYGVNGARYYLRTVNPWFGHSHNSILESIYIAGYAGAALTVFGLGWSFRRLVCERDLPDRRIFALTLCYIFVAGMMNPAWYETSSLIVISVVCAGPGGSEIQERHAARLRALKQNRP